MNKYRIECGENLKYADLLSQAKFYAGAMILQEQICNRDAQVRVIRQLGRPASWSAHLLGNGDVVLRALFCDCLDIPAALIAADRANALAAIIDREARRREHHRKRREALRKKRSDCGVGKPVV